MGLLDAGVAKLVEKAVEKVAGGSDKKISARTHGYIDYGHAAFFLAVGLLCRKRNKAASNAALFTSAFVVVQSLLTDYPVGVVPVISFETHGKIDAAFASASWVIPKALGFAGTLEARIFEGNTAVEGAVVRMTDWTGEHAHPDA